MPTINDWNDKPVAYRRSRGASSVLTLESWEDNVLRGAVDPWPPPDLLKKVRGDTARANSFHPEDAEALAAHLGGRISKSQSINGEDVVTFSWFGTLQAADPATRRVAVQWLYDRMGIPAEARAPSIDQWRRVYHPSAPSSPNGPELDARIDDPGGALVYVEAKWHAKIGTGKGKSADVSHDQIQLRRDSLREDPALADDRRAHAVLGVSEVKPDLAKWKEPPGQLRPVTVAWLTWDELAECPHHPLAAEFRAYLAWKRRVA